MGRTMMGMMGMMGIMDGADPVDRLYGFVGLGPADRRFISRMHFTYLRPRGLSSALSLGLDTA